MDGIPLMHPLTNFDSAKSDDGEGFVNDVPLNDQDGGNLEKTPQNGDKDLMANQIILIEKQNGRLIKLMSQLPRAPMPSVVEHRDGYAASPFVEMILKASLPKKLNLPILIATYDESTDPTKHIA